MDTIAEGVCGLRRLYRMLRCHAEDKKLWLHTYRQTDH